MKFEKCPILIKFAVFFANITIIHSNNIKRKAINSCCKPNAWPFKWRDVSIPNTGQTCVGVPKSGRGCSQEFCVTCSNAPFLCWRFIFRQGCTRRLAVSRDAPPPPPNAYVWYRYVRGFGDHHNSPIMPHNMIDIWSKLWPPISIVLSGLWITLIHSILFGENENLILIVTSNTQIMS